MVAKRKRHDIFESISEKEYFSFQEYYKWLIGFNQQRWSVIARKLSSRIIYAIPNLTKAYKMPWIEVKMWNVYLTFSAKERKIITEYPAIKFYKILLISMDNVHEMVLFL